MVTKKRVKLTPELLITHPRRSAATLSPHGTHALYTVSTYSLDSHSETNEVKIMDVKTGESTLFTDDKENSSPQWLGVGNKVMWLRSKKGATELWIGNAIGEKGAYLAGEIDAAIVEVKTKPLPDGNVAFAFAANKTSEGKLFNAEKAEKPYTTAREYESMEVRYWDRYYTAEKSTLWYTVLEPHGSVYKLSPNFVDALEDTGMEFPYTPISPLGDGGSFDISVSGLVVSSRDPAHNLAFDYKNTIYYVPLTTFTEEDPKPIQIEFKDFKGSADAPSFSPDGTHLAFKQQKGLRRPVDNSKMCVVPLTGVPSISEAVAVVQLTNPDGNTWDRDPGSFFWSNDMKSIYITAEEYARTKLFKTSPKPSDDGTWSSAVYPLTTNGSISAAQPLTKADAETRVFVSYNSFVDSSVYAILDTAKATSLPTPRIVSDLAHGSALLGLKGRSQVEEFWAPADPDDGDYKVQAWVIKPSFFKEGEKYPLWFEIHGGPQATTADFWSTRWNPAVWAEQGFICVMPNATGSTSFGFKYTDAVTADWGGRCYRDLVQCHKYIEEHLPYVDLDRAVAGGGSFGGYMTNWIAGQPLGQKFKALVSHDGIFSHVNMLASDVPSTFDVDVGRHPWEDGGVEAFDRYAPSSYTKGWSVPMLIIHSDNDFRCPITEGLATFNVCQMKGIPSRFLNFPDENHFVQKRENSLQWYYSVLGWCNYWAKNEEMGVKLKEPLTRGPYKPYRTITGR